jgi:hypothetical protein
MDNLNNNSNNDNLNNDNLNDDNPNNENQNIRTFYFNHTQTNEDILQQITSFINNISNINQVNHENNTNSMDVNNNDDDLGSSGISGISDGSNMNQNIQMFFEIEFVIDQENIGDDDDTSHFDDCNHINEILGKAIYIKKDDPILETDCGICMDNYKYKQYKRILPECKHTFHKKCIDSWFKKNSSCPVCRKDFLTVQNNAS